MWLFAISNKQDLARHTGASAIRRACDRDAARQDLQAEAPGNRVIEQIAIGVCGVTSIYLTNDPRENWRRWACIFGMTAQPFWMYATFTASQWGIFGLSFLYAWGWSRGIRHRWIKRK